jgi:hypothetical protein
MAAAVAPAEAMHAPVDARLGRSPATGIDAATRHHHPDVVSLPTRVIIVDRADGFDWRDAGIGMGGTLGAVLLVSGSALLLRRNRHQASADRQKGVPAV